jgi:hypothetical protein
MGWTGLDWTGMLLKVRLFSSFAGMVVAIVDCDCWRRMLLHIRDAILSRHMFCSMHCRCVLRYILCDYLCKPALP